MKNRILTFTIAGLTILALIGLFAKVFSNPAGFFKGIAIMIVIGAVIFFLVRLFYKPSPKKREQQAFVKAAKRSTKKHLFNQPVRKTTHSNLTSIKKARAKKKNPNSHLTVIEGRKGKKKNRASF